MEAAGHGSLDMTFVYTLTEDDREREHVGKIIERLGLAKASTTTAQLEQMNTQGGIQ